MDMPCNDNFFTLIFYDVYGGEEYKVNKFYESQESLFNLEPSVVFQENTDIELLFNSNIKNSRLYMDGLETLPEKLVENDENNIPYREPNSEKFSLFKNQDEYYPLIPGTYQAYVKIDEINYYFVVEITPKRITNSELDIIKSDLEFELKGLAQDLIRKNIGLGSNQYNIMPSKHLYKFLVIKNNFNDVMNALTDLYTKVNYKVQKKYKYVNSTKSCNKDEVTIKSMLTSAKKDNCIKVPYKTFDYNLPENQWIKSIIKRVSKTLINFENIVNKYIGELERDIEKEKEYDYEPTVRAVIKEKNKVLEDLKTYYCKARKMRNAFSIIEATSWYKQIDDKFANKVPFVMFADPRYRIIYKLYRDLEDDSAKVKLDSSYSYNWKRTDKLYEMWGFVKLYKLLTNGRMNYTVDSGWIFSKNTNEVDYSYIIPSLDSGTSINMCKENIELRLVYDEKLPNKSKETKRDVKPLYTVGIHTRPDTRIDVYIDKIYIGSIVIDFKYRNPKHIWNTYKRTDSTRQLISYATTLRSIYTFGDKTDKNYKSQYNPVKEVWAIYPKDDTSIEQNFYEDYKVALIKMCPGIEYDYIEERINFVLKEMIDVYKRLP